MPNPQPELSYGKYFHIYNRGTNGCNIFTESKNYEYFLLLYDKYISEIAETYAWVLMPNHFHFLIRIKDENAIGFNPKKQIIKKTTLDYIEKQTIISSSDFKNDDFIFEKYKPVNQFSNLFNAYAQSYNKVYKRTGSLFEHTFHRKEVDNSGYYKQMIMYIHNNPVHHGFCSHPVEYGWSSYMTCISDKQTKLQRGTVIGWFENIDNFISMHQKDFSTTEIDNWLGMQII